MAEEVASEVLALSKMDWNNDALYNHLPVTITYAKTSPRPCADSPASPVDRFQFGTSCSSDTVLAGGVARNASSSA